MIIAGGICKEMIRRVVSVSMKSGEMKALPDMIEPRHGHSSMCTANKVFVACGYTGKKDPKTRYMDQTSSIEYLDLNEDATAAAETWTLIDVD